MSSLCVALLIEKTPPETRLSPMRHAQRLLIHLVCWMPSIVANFGRNRSKLTQVTCAVAVSPRIRTGENSIQQGTPNERCRQQAAARFCCFHQRGQQSIAAPIELSSTVDDQFLRESRLIERE